MRLLSHLVVCQGIPRAALWLVLILAIEPTVDPRVAGADSGATVQEISKLLDLAKAHLFLGEYGSALKSAKDAQRLLEASPEIKQETMALFVVADVGTIYLYLDDPESATKVFDEGAVWAPEILANRTHDPVASKVTQYEGAVFYSRMAIAELELNCPADARVAIHKGLKAARSSGFQGLEDFLCLNQLRSTADTPQARGQALRMMHQCNDIGGGWLLNLQQDSGVSASYFQHLMEKVPGLAALMSREDRVQLYLQIARGLRKEGHLPEAVHNYFAAISLIESGRERAAGTGALPLFFSTFVDVYNETIETLYELDRKSPRLPLDAELSRFGSNYAEVALYVSESSHARRFSERYGRALITSFGMRENIPQTVLNRERQLRVQMFTTVDPALGSLEIISDPVTARQRSERAAADYVNFLDDLQAKYPTFAALAFPRPATMRQLPASADGTFLVIYKVAPDAVYWWVILNRQILAFERSEISRSRLRERVQAFRKFIDDPAPAELDQALVSGPFDRIQKSGASHTDTTPHVAIVPDDVLYLVPWEALRGPDNRYLGESFVISYAPAITVLAQVLGLPSNLSTNKSSLVVGNAQEQPLNLLIDGTPQPPFDPLDVLELTSVVSSLQNAGYTSEILKGKRATGDSLLEADLTKFAIVHFDTHAFAESKDPLPSLILHPSECFPSGLFGLSDIARLKLRAELVTLSACQTALGQKRYALPGEGIEGQTSNPVPGEGVEGLGQVFMLAGSRSVLVSLWPANRAATATLMARFYKHLGAGGSGDEAWALFHAKADLRKETHAAPSKWAPFILIGGAKR